MKRRNIFFALFALSVFSLTLLCRLWPRVIPEEKCSEVYKKYAHVEGVNAVFIKDKRVNDTMTVDVTLLEATDSIGWERLRTGFKIQKLPKELETIMEADSNLVVVKSINKKDPALPPDSTNKLNNDFMAISYHKHMLCIFTIKELEQLRAIIEYNIDYNTTSNKSLKTNFKKWLKLSEQSKR